MKVKYLTCSLCNHFDAVNKKCSVLPVNTTSSEREYASTCAAENRFVRNINVIPDYFNYFNDDEVPVCFEEDLSSLPKDDEGNPLFVITKRGLERAIPADPEMKLKSSRFIGVEKIYTLQGQSELLQEIGYAQLQKLAFIKCTKISPLLEMQLKCV